MKLQCILKDVLRKEGNSAPLSLAEVRKNWLGLELCECGNLPGAEVGWGNGRTFLLDLGWVIVNNFKGTFQSKEAVKPFLRVLSSSRWKSQRNQSWVLKKKRGSRYEGAATRQLFIKVPSAVAPSLPCPESHSWSITMTSETCSHWCSHGKKICRQTTNWTF